MSLHVLKTIEMRYCDINYARLSVDFDRLDKVSCEQILFRIKGRGVFSGIERERFNSELLGGEHYKLFNGGEVKEFTDATDNSDLFKPIRSACHRVGARVLWAVYDTLLSTRDSPGAVQHGNIANKLQESVTQSLATGECNHGWCEVFIHGAIYMHSLCPVIFVRQTIWL